MDETGHPPDDFAGAFEAAFASFQVRVEEACVGSATWADGMSAAIQATLEFAADEPGAANVLTNEAMAGQEGGARRERLLSYAGEALAGGRRQEGGAADLPKLTEHAVAGGIAALIAERLATGRADELPALAPQAIQFALTPYLGAEEAKRIAAATGRAGPRDR
ncbi:MAG TPA: hypothetical protein VHQ43_04290 [Solirubrobacterales bacterium]|jgi:hypothetical protein|nr:hypothetical protein [Solirubrobacterales bacterium]